MNISEETLISFQMNFLERISSWARVRPLALDVVHYPQERTHLIFSWNHSAMDAHGAEMLFKFLGNEQSEDLSHQFLADSNSFKISWKENLSEAKEVKDFLSDTLNEPIATLPRGSQFYKGPSHYRRIDFDESETQMIDRQAQLLGTGPFTSALYLAAVASGLQKIMMARGQELGDFFSTRASGMFAGRGGFGPVFANHVTFLFYRILHDHVGDLQKTVQDLLNQLQGMMRQRVQHAYANAMELFRYFPLPFYWKFL